MSIIVITGCSSGIGFATASTLARQGHTVYATSRTPETSPELKHLSEEVGNALHILQLDVLSDDSVDKAFKYILQKEGQVDVLINNAGVHTWGSVEETPVNTFQLQWVQTILAP